MRIHVTEEILYIIEIEDRYIRNDGRTVDIYIIIYIYTNGKSRLTSLVWGSLRLAPITSSVNAGHLGASLSMPGPSLVSQPIYSQQTKNLVSCLLMT